MSRVQPAPKRRTRPQPRRKMKAAYLTRRLAYARNVLADVMATDAQRHGARCRLNRTIRILRALEPIVAMKRPLETDKRKERRPIVKVRTRRVAMRELLAAAEGAA